MHSVIIVGGGLAGLSAALELHKRGLAQVRLLEAAPNIGGRIRSRRFAGLTVEEGASWVHGTSGSNPTLDLVQEHGWGYVAVTDAFTMPGVLPRDAEAAASAAEAALDRLEGWAQAHCVPEEDASLSEALAGCGWVARTAAERAVQAFHADFRFGEAAEHTSIFHNVIEEYTEADFGQEEVLITDQRGLTGLVEAMAAELPPAWVVCGCRVTRIEQTPGDEGLIKVWWRSREGELHSAQAQAAICTVSIGVLQHGGLEFDPPLEHARVCALGSLRMCGYTKVFLSFASVFWSEEHEYLLCADDEFPVWHSMQGHLRVPVLVAHCTGEHSRRIERLSDEAVRQRAMRAVLRMYPHAPCPLEVLVTRWSEDPLHRGAYSFAPTQTPRDVFEALGRARGRLHFAAMPPSLCR